MEGDFLGLNLAVLDVDLIAAENDGDVVADTNKILVPVGDVLVGDARGDIEHDDGALAADVVAITEPAELLLAGSIPDVEADSATVGVEGDRVDLDTESGDVPLLEFASDVALHKGGLTDTTVTDENALEVGFSHFYVYIKRKRIESLVCIIKLKIIK